MIVFKMHLSIVLDIKYRPKMFLICILKSLKNVIRTRNVQTADLCFRDFYQLLLVYFTKVFCFVKTIDCNARRSIIVMPPFEEFTHCVRFSSRSKHLVQSHSLYVAVR